MKVPEIVRIFAANKKSGRSMAKFINPFTDVLNRMPWLAQEAVFQRLASIADVASLNKQERQAYDEDLRKYRDTVAVMEGNISKDGLKE